MTDGASNRKNVVCPGCAVVERHRLLKLFLQAKTDIYHEPHRVLYFAPEYSLQEHLQQLKNIAYISADIDSSLAMEQFDIMDIPHPDASFSIIFCSHVLAHVKDDLKALQELHRIMRADGYLIMMDLPADIPKTLEFENVNTSEERANAYGQNDRWRLYGRDFVSRIESKGFKVMVEDYTKELSEDLIEKYRISKEDKIYVCRKNLNTL